MARLESVGVDATWKTVVAELAPKVAAVLPARPPVSAIYINRTGKPNARFPVADWTVPAADPAITAGPGRWRWTCSRKSC